MYICEDVLVREPARLGRQEPLVQLAPHVHEREPGGREQVLHRSRGEEVDAELRDVERDRAGRLVAVGEAERAALVREPRDLGDVEPVTRSERDRRTADERRPLVDRLAKRSSGIRPSESGCTWTTSAPRSSCACAICPTVGNSNSRDHDLPALAAPAGAR